jgi:hypothetical protein
VQNSLASLHQQNLETIMPLFWKSKPAPKAESTQIQDNTPRLMPCMDCRGKVSTQAPQCPHCNTKFPQGITCVVCVKKGRYADGVHLGSGSRWMHKPCYELIMSDLQPYKFTCSVCKHTQMVDPIKNNTFSSKPCSNCGQPIPREYQLEACYYCGVTMVVGKGVPINGPFGSVAHRACYKGRTG